MAGSSTSIGKTRNLRREAWHTLCSIRLTIILLSAILFVSVIGTLFPQPTPETHADELALAQWEAALQERYGAFRELYRVLGLLNVYSSPIFLILLAALLTNGIACTVNRLGPICKAITAKPKAARRDSFYETAANRASLEVASIDEARKQTASLLSRHRYRLQTEERDGVTYIVGHRNRLARVGTLITHTALVLIAVGVLWSGCSAWREPAVILGPGQSYDVRHGHQFQVQHKGFEVERYANGFPKDYRSHLLVLEHGSEVLRRAIRVNDPLTYRGVSFYLSSSGPALRVLGWEENGEPLPLQLPPDGEATKGKAVLNFSAEGDEKSLYLPSLDMTLHVSLYTQSPPEDASEEPFLFVEAFRTGQDQPLFSDYVGQGETVQLSTARFQFVADMYSVIQVVSDPGFAPIVMASFLGMGGLLISFYFYPSRVWAKLTDIELLLAGSAERHRVKFEADFAKLVEELEAGLR